MSIEIVNPPRAHDAWALSAPEVDAIAVLLFCKKVAGTFFPMSTKVIEELGGELEPYRTGKGTISFCAEEPLPASLVKRIVEARIEENAARRRR